MGKCKCPKCKSAFMVYIPDKGGYVCLQCGNDKQYHRSKSKGYREYCKETL